jgi:mannose-6-phosphate isomerase-like protein (cupin superfamily)
MGPFINRTNQPKVVKITKRDLTVASITACLTMIAMFASSKTSILDSSIFDWNDIAVKNTSTGSVRTFFRSQTATLDELECHVTTLNPSETSHPPHKHPEEEVIIIKEGTLEALVNGQMKRVGAGSVIFQAANQMHAIRNVGDTPATYHVFSWHSPGTMKK